MSGTETVARLPRLLKAMRSVGTGQELGPTLDRICETAAELVDARYAAVGVVAENGAGFSDFVQYGVDTRTAREVGPLPQGHAGLLGALIHDLRPVRLTDLRTDARSSGFPVSYPPMRGFMGVPVRVHSEDFGNLYVAEKNVGGFTDHDLDMLRVLAAEAGIAISNARLYEAAKQRERWIDGSVAVTTALLSGGEADEALEIVAEQARALSGSTAGIVLLPAAEGGLEIVAISSDQPSDARGLIIPPDSELVTELLAGEAVFVDDAATDPRRLTRLAPHFGPVMLLPLKSDGRVMGTLVTPRAPGARPFTETERNLAARFASLAALALMTAEVQRDQERLAVFEDRDRIARDLHDLVIKRLFTTGMMLESAQRGALVPEVRRGVGKAVDELDITIQEIRAAVFALQDVPEETPAALRTRVLREIKMTAAPLGFTPSCRFAGPVDTAVGEVTGAHLIASLRETLSNAFRHARATRIDVIVDAAVTLPGGAPGVRLTVADDGVGMVEGGRRSGLQNLERRATSLGGDSWYGPGLGENGGGTTVVWQAPH